METLKKFNDSPNEDKLKIYHKMTFYHNTIFESDNLFKIRRKLYEVDKSLLDYYYSKRNNHEFDLKFDMWYDSYSNFNDYEFHCGKNYNISSTSIYFSYKEFEQGIHEIEEFSRWFNDVNVTVNNPYFDRNFVEKYRELLSTIKE
jgi:hypothetical protein